MELQEGLALLEEPSALNQNEGYMNHFLDFVQYLNLLSIFQLPLMQLILLFADLYVVSLQSIKINQLIVVQLIL